MAACAAGAHRQQDHVHCGETFTTPAKGKVVVDLPALPLHKLLRAACTPNRPS